VATLILGLGYLGAALARDLLAGGEAVVGLDNGFATDWPAVEGLGAGLPGRFTLLRGDLRDTTSLEAAFRAAAPVGTVFLLAAQASAHPQAAPPEYTEETNLRGPRLVFEGALRHGRPPVVYGSSFHVYGPGLRGEVDERRPYGAQRDLAHLSKVYAEKLGEMMAGTEGVPCSPVRLGIVYGLGPVTKSDLRFVTAPHAFCLRAIAGEPLPIHPAGLQPAGYVHLADAVAALRLAAALPTRERPYVPANAVAETASALEVARLVQRIAWAAGHDATLRLHTPGPPEAPEAPEGADGTPGGQAFTVRSVLDGVGWHPVGRLAEDLPRIFAHYAAGQGLRRDAQGASRP
jgi:nucleoside-diphosphate-sugar epimerase